MARLAVFLALASWPCASAGSQPIDDDRVIWVTNGTMPGEYLVGLLNTGRKGLPHKIEARFDYLVGQGLAPGAYTIFDETRSTPVNHPRDTFGANVLPEAVVLLKLTPIAAPAPPVPGALPEFPAATTDAGAAVAALMGNWYQETSGLWDRSPGGAQWWNSANSLELLCNYAEYARADAYFSQIVNNTFARTSLNETLTGRYDDEGWWSLAWIRAYEVFGDERYLDRAAAIFADLAVNAWDGSCGGGVWWSYAKAYKNAITNELYLAVAAKLAPLRPTSVVAGRTYGAWAAATWTWFEHSGLINAARLVNDGLVDDATCANNGQTEWTYNQGVVLGGLAWLYQLDRNTTLLDVGVDIAKATIASMVWNSSVPVLKESCDAIDANGCDLDQEQFKGIFVRYLMHANPASRTPPPPGCRARE